MRVVSHQTITVACVSCGLSFELAVPAVIDAAVDAAALAELVDGPHLQTQCPRCGAMHPLDFPMLVVLDTCALPLWFIPANGTTNEEDSADWLRLSALLQAARPAEWNSAWQELFWVVTRAEFPTVALGRRFASSEAAPLLPVLTEFRRADSSETLLTLLANHPELLGDAAQALLQEIIDQHWLRRSEGPASDYEDDLSLLISCREVGTARTLSELDRSVSADLAGLHALADAATERDEQTPSVETLAARLAAQRAILNHAEFAAAPAGFRWRIHLGLAYILHDAYERDPDRLDALGDAIAAMDEALDLVPVLARRERCQLLNSLGHWHMSLFAARDDRMNINAAISAWQQAYTIAPKGDPKSLMIVGNLGRSLRDRFDLLRDVTDLDRAVQVLQEAYQTAVLYNRANQIAPSLNSLGIAYHRRYEVVGDKADLERAITSLDAGARQPGADITVRRMAARNLSISLEVRFLQFGNLDDINTAISLLTQLARSAPDADDFTSIVGTLGGAYVALYNRTRDRQDLDAAVSIYEQHGISTSAVAARFAAALLARYDLQGDLDDLRKSIALLESTLGSSDIRTDLAVAHVQLGEACERAYALGHERAWIDRAIAHFEAASSRTPADAPALADRLFHLGRAMAVRARASGDHVDCANAERHLDHAAQAGLLRDPQQALSAAQYWGDWSIERGAWDAAARAFNYAAQAITTLLRAQPDRAARELLLRTAQGLAVAQAHALAKTGRVEDAIAALENGRNRLRDRTRLSEAILSRLVTAGHGALAQRYLDHAAALVALESAPAGAEEPEGAAVRTDATARDLQLARVRVDLHVAVNEIDRVLDLDGPWATAAALDVTAATRAPRGPIVVYLATHRTATLALIVAQGRVRAAWLDFDEPALDALLLTPKAQSQLSATEIETLSVQRRTETVYGSVQAVVEQYAPQRADAFQEVDRPWSRERYLDVGAVTGGWLAAQRGHITYRQALDAVLPVVWSRLHEPLARQIRSTGAAPTWIALVPCGKLAVLPLHAGWEWGAPADTRPSRLFTYVPSARVLTASRPAAAFPAVTPGGTNVNFLGIGNAQPQDAPLHYAELEVTIAASAVQVPPAAVLLGDVATLANVARQLPTATLLHFACHGSFDAANPMGSALYLAGGTLLRLADVMRFRLAGNPLAILSACETAITDTRFLPDEALGLANGFLDAGARGVVSTLWPVNDVSTMLLMEQFYRLYAGPHPQATLALRDAADWLRRATAETLRSRLDRIRSTLPTGHELLPPVIKQFRRFAALPPDEQPFAHPGNHRAGFTYSGR